MYTAQLDLSGNQNKVRELTAAMLIKHAQTARSPFKEAGKAFVENPTVSESCECVKHLFLPVIHSSNSAYFLAWQSPPSVTE